MTRLRATSQITGKRTEVFDPAWCRLLLDNSSESWLTCWGVGVTDLTCSIFDKRLTMCLLPAQFSIVGELWNGLRSASEVCCGPSTCDQVCVMCISTLIGSSLAPCVVGSPALCHRWSEVVASQTVAIPVRHRTCMSKTFGWCQRFQRTVASPSPEPYCRQPVDIIRAKYSKTKGCILRQTRARASHNH